MSYCDGRRALRCDLGASPPAPLPTSRCLTSADGRRDVGSWSGSLLYIWSALMQRSTLGFSKMTLLSSPMSSLPSPESSSSSRIFTACVDSDSAPAFISSRKRWISFMVTTPRLSVDVESLTSAEMRCALNFVSTPAHARASTAQGMRMLHFGGASRARVDASAASAAGSRAWSSAKYANTSAPSSRCLEIASPKIFSTAYQNLSNSIWNRSPVCVYIRRSARRSMNIWTMTTSASARFSAFARARAASRMVFDRGTRRSVLMDAGTGGNEDHSKSR